tara:strand:- start:132 stop:656 length:525 start_codon:yes stop_codon:yes gene_type:complete
MSSQKDKERISKHLHETMSRPELLKVLQIGGETGFGNKNKTQMINRIIKMNEDGNLKYIEAKAVVREIRQALGLSVSGNIKSATQGIRKNKKDESKSAKELASDAMKAVRDALAAAERKPKLSKQIKTRIAKEINDFENDLAKITKMDKVTRAKVGRAKATERYKDSAELKQDV